MAAVRMAGMDRNGELYEAAVDTLLALLRDESVSDVDRLHVASAVVGDLLDSGDRALREIYRDANAINREGNAVHGRQVDAFWEIAKTLKAGS